MECVHFLFARLFILFSSEKYGKIWAWMLGYVVRASQAKRWGFAARRCGSGKVARVEFQTVATHQNYSGKLKLKNGEGDFTGCPIFFEI